MNSTSFKSFTLPLFCIVLVSLFSACSSSQKEEGPIEKRGGAHRGGFNKNKPKSVGAPLTGLSEISLYDEIQEHFRAQKYDLCVARTEEYQRRFQKGKNLAPASNYGGLCSLTARYFNKAISHFQIAIHSNTDSGLKSFYLFNLASAQFEIESASDTLKTLDEIVPDQLNPSTRYKFHFLKAKAYQKQDQASEALRSVMSASQVIPQIAPDPAQTYEVRKPIENQLKLALTDWRDFSLLEKIYSEFQDAPLSDALLMEMGKLAQKQGRGGVADVYWQTLMRKFPESSYYLEAKALARGARSNETTNLKSIGVLLPLSGKYANFGQRSLNGILSAFHIFSEDNSSSDEVLVIEDAGETPESALIALDKLYNEHHVIAVIGPILAKGLDQISRRAQEYGLPLLSLAQQPVEEGGAIINIGLTPKNQAKEIATYAVKNAGLKRFAIIFPNTKTGDESAQTFWDTVEELGGQVRGFESYSASETDFRAVVDRIVGLAYADSRTREMDALTKYRDDNKIKKRTRMTEKYFSLPPIVDVDAVFIPDDARVAGQILPTFLYRDVEEMRFLGTSLWNSKALIERGGPLTKGALFVDSYFEKNVDPDFKAFHSRFEKSFAYPPAIYEVTAFDAGQLALRVVRDSNYNSSRYDFLRGIREIPYFTGSSGKIAMQFGVLQRKLKVLTVKNNEIVEASSL